MVPKPEASVVPGPTVGRGRPAPHIPAGVWVLFAILSWKHEPQLSSE